MTGRVFRVGMTVPLLLIFMSIAVAASAVPPNRATPKPIPAKEKFTSSVPTNLAKDIATSVEEAAGDAQGWVDEHGWSGFGHIGVDRVGEAVDIFGTTSPPPGLLTYLKGRYPSISFVYIKSAFTSAELLAAAANIPQKFLTGPYALSMVGADEGDNGLVVAPVDQSLLAPAKAQSLVAAIGSAYPVKVVAGYGEGHLTATRASDSPPFWGGGLASNASNGGAICTEGVEVFHGSTPNRTYGMTTAAHCGQGYFYTPGNAAYIGRTHLISSPARDTQMLIDGDTTAGGYGYDTYLYSGGWNSGLPHSVRNGGNPPPNSSVCISGGVSGEICSLQVASVDTYAYLNGVSYGPGFYFQNNAISGGNYLCAMQLGDSGAPVYRLNSDNSVTVAGLQNSGWGSPVPAANCQGNPAFRNTAYSIGFAIRISSALASLTPTVALGTTTTGGHN